jgi:cobalamin biosynthesis Co2+ chelatase CbiK
VAGLGSIQAIQELYVKHTADAMGQGGEGGNEE